MLKAVSRQVITKQIVEPASAAALITTVVLLNKKIGPHSAEHHCLIICFIRVGNFKLSFNGKTWTMILL